MMILVKCRQFQSTVQKPNSENCLMLFIFLLSHHTLHSKGGVNGTPLRAMNNEFRELEALNVDTATQLSIHKVMHFTNVLSNCVYGIESDS